MYCKKIRKKSKNNKYLYKIFLYISLIIIIYFFKYTFNYILTFKKKKIYKEYFIYYINLSFFKYYYINSK